MTEEIVQLPLHLIVKNPYQPRLVFDTDKLEELAQSIKENGVLQPIIVRKSDLLGYELLAGERRFQASKLAGKTYIPALIREYTDQEMMTLSILENLQRENLNPVEEARSLTQLSEKLGLTHEEIAKTLGKSRSYVSNLIRLLSLPAPLLDYVEKGELSPAHGRTLLAEKNLQKQRHLAEKAVAEHLNVRELERLIYGERRYSSPPPAQKASANIFINETEQLLHQALGNKVKIKANKNYQGTLSIDFTTLEELEQLIKLLKK